MVHICPYCSERVRSSINKHIQTQHRFEPPQYKCSKCSNTYLTPAELKHHLRKAVHIEGLSEPPPRNIHIPQFECNICQEKFHTQNELDRHMAYPYLHCALCKQASHFQLFQSHLLNKHRLNVVRADMYNYMLDIPQPAASSSSSSHSSDDILDIIAVEPQIGHTSSPSVSLASTDSLNDDVSPFLNEPNIPTIAKHDEVKEREYAHLCKICMKSFANDANIFEHVQQPHCTICRQSVPFSALASHLQSQHNIDDTKQQDINDYIMDISISVDAAPKRKRKQQQEERPSDERPTQIQALNPFEAPSQVIASFDLTQDDDNDHENIPSVLSETSYEEQDSIS